MIVTKIISIIEILHTVHRQQRQLNEKLMIRLEYLFKLAYIKSEHEHFFNIQKLYAQGINFQIALCSRL